MPFFIFARSTLCNFLASYVVLLLTDELCSPGTDMEIYAR